MRYEKSINCWRCNGIGLLIATQLLKREDCEKVYVVDKALVAEQYLMALKM